MIEGIIYSALAAIALTVATVILPLIATPRIEPIRELDGINKKRNNY